MTATAHSLHFTSIPFLQHYVISYNIYFPPNISFYLSNFKASNQFFHFIYIYLHHITKFLYFHFNSSPMPWESRLIIIITTSLSTLLNELSKLSYTITAQSNLVYNSPLFIKFREFFHCKNVEYSST